MIFFLHYVEDKKKPFRQEWLFYAYSDLIKLQRRHQIQMLQQPRGEGEHLQCSVLML